MTPADAAFRPSSAGAPNDEEWIPEFSDGGDAGVAYSMCDLLKISFKRLRVLIREGVTGELK
jgi:hypothetical protein